MADQVQLQDIAEAARRIRVEVVRMCAKAAGHVGGSFSMAEIVAALYFRILKVDPRNPKWDGRDYFILSKGHAVPALHAALALRGFFPMEWLPKSKTIGSCLSGHASTLVPGIDASTGSMGHGLPVALGIALAVKSDGAANRVFVLLGDGEMQEGSNWEAITRAAHPSCAKRSAALSASRTVGPVAMMVRSSPSRSVTALPISNGRDSSVPACEPPPRQM